MKTRTKNTFLLTKIKIKMRLCAKGKLTETVVSAHKLKLHFWGRKLA